MDPKLDPFATALRDNAKQLNEMAQTFRDLAERLKPCVFGPDTQKALDELVPLLVQDASRAIGNFQLAVDTAEAIIARALP